MTRIAAFDIDGTVADDRWRLPLIDRESPDPVQRYERYHLAAPADLPINQELVEWRRERGDQVWFVTARPIVFYAQTDDWLRKHFPGLQVRLRMRGNEDRRPSPALKLDQIRALQEEGDVVAVYEDRPDVCKALHEEGFPVIRILPNGAETSISTQAKPQAGSEYGLLDHLKRSVSAADVLKTGAATFAERNRVYGDNYKRFGPVMAALFPAGCTINTPEEWNRWGVFMQMASKFTRLANAELSHVDSAHDLMVYSAMLEELLHD